MAKIKGILSQTSGKVEGLATGQRVNESTSLRVNKSTSLRVERSKSILDNFFD